MIDVIQHIFVLFVVAVNVQRSNSLAFDTRTDLVFQNPGILKSHDIVIYLIQIDLFM